MFSGENEMMVNKKLNKKNVLLTTALLGILPFGLAAEEVKGEFDQGYFKFKSADGNFKWKFDGRIMLDAKRVSSDENDRLTNTNTDFRRARLAIKTEFYKDWAGEFDIDFKENKTKVKDMWIAYTGFDNTVIKVGNHKPFFSMAELTTSRWYPLMETSSITDFTATGRRIGASVSYWQPEFFVGASVFGEEVGGNDVKDDEDIIAREETGYSARAVYRPWVSSDKSKLIHLGYNVLNHKPLSEDGGDFKVKGEVYDITLATPGKFKVSKGKAVDDINASSIELAAKWDKFYFQSEYVQNTISFKESLYEDYEVSGYYAEMSYFILGEGRPYNLHDAEFGSVVPKGKGELEFVVRYDEFDANDKGAGEEGEGILAGKFSNLTFGLNYYINSNVVVRLNHSFIDSDEYANDDGDINGDDKISVTGLRFQYMF